MIRRRRSTTAAAARHHRPGGLPTLALASLLAGCAGQSEPARTAADAAPEVVPSTGNPAAVARRLATLEALRERGLIEEGRYRQWRTRLQGTVTD